jgi:hypothetical protein
MFAETARSYFEAKVFPLQNGMKFLTLAAMRDTISRLTGPSKKVRYESHIESPGALGHEKKFRVPLDALPNLREVILVYELKMRSDVYVTRKSDCLSDHFRRCSVS